MNYILTQNNNSKYPEIPLCDPSDGINFINGTYKPTVTLYYKDTVTGTLYHKSQNWGTRCIAVLYHAHGTITRKDITDGTTFYYFVDDGPSTDDLFFIPCNIESDVTYVDEWYFRMHNNSNNSINHGWYNVYINVFPCNNDYKSISTTFTVDLQVDCYCL